MQQKRFILRAADIRDNCTRFIQGINLNPEDLVEVNVRDFRKSRSLEQNATMHMWFDDIARATGHTPLEVKSFFKAEYITPEVKEVMGKVVEIERGTSDLNVKEASEFMERISAHAGEMGIALRHPEDRAA